MDTVIISFPVCLFALLKEKWKNVHIERVAILRSACVHFLIIFENVNVMPAIMEVAMCNSLHKAKGEAMGYSGMDQLLFVLRN